MVLFFAKTDLRDYRLISWSHELRRLSISIRRCAAFDRTNYCDVVPKILISDDLRVKDAERFIKESLL